MKSTTRNSNNNNKVPFVEIDHNSEKKHYELVLQNKQKPAHPDHENSDDNVESNGSLLKKETPPPVVAKPDASFRKLADSLFSSIVFESYIAEKYLFWENGKFSVYAFLKITTFILSALFVVLFAYYFVSKQTQKSSDKSPNSGDLSIPKESPEAKNTISLKGRVKKVPRNINYGELFINLENNQNNNNISTLKIENNACNLNDFIEKCDKTHNNANNVNKSFTVDNYALEKKPLAKTKDDLLFFEDVIDEPKEVIDTNMEFLIKDVKITPTIVEKTENEKEPTDSEKLMARLRNSGNFHQTEISKMAHHVAKK